MARGNTTFTSTAFAICLVLLVVVGLPGLYGFAPPAPLGIDAPPQLFSAARARLELIRLLGDETPHPMGSTANRQVKARLVERLTQLGLVVELQNDIGCNIEFAICGRVENVLAQIPGEHESAVLLMAHYDSVNAAPGAGDDGAGVAALLEVARIVQSLGPHRNSILFAFTDGEEAGSLGAEAFFAEHPWAKRVETAINLDGRGSAGPSMLLRSAPMSGTVLDIFRAVVPHPIASSFAEELFKRIPADTDFSVAIRAGKPGFDFAFSGEANHYHTPLDIVGNLDPATLQHHGDNVLPVLLALVDADLSMRTPNYVYTNLTSSVWLAYSPKLGFIVAVIGIVLLTLATWRRWQGLDRFGSAVGVVALAFVAIIALEIGALALADLITGTRVAWPPEPWPWRLVIYAVPVFVLALLRPLVHRIGFWNTLLAPWWLWALLVLAQAWYAPLATHVMLPVTTVAAGVIVLLAFVASLDRPTIRCAAALINVLVAGYFILPPVYILETTEGWAFAPVLSVPLALLAVTLLPLLDRGRARNPRRVALLAMVAGFTWMNWVPLYSQQRPQHLNFTYTLDADADLASYSARSANPVPSAVQAVLPFELHDSPSPWEHIRLPVAPATMEHRATTVLERLPTQGRTRSYLLRPGAATAVVGLTLRKQDPIDAIRIAGHAVGIDPRGSQDFRWAYFVAPPAEGIKIEIDAAGDTPIDAYLIDQSIGLPASGEALVKARGALAVPVAQGDIWTIFQRVKL